MVPLVHVQEDGGKSKKKEPIKSSRIQRSGAQSPDIKMGDISRIEASPTVPMKQIVSKKDISLAPNEKEEEKVPGTGTKIGTFLKLKIGFKNARNRIKENL